MTLKRQCRLSRQPKCDAPGKQQKTVLRKGTRFIDIRFFFVTDRIARQDLWVEYCSTKQILGDYFTKPLQGSTFRTLQNQILNIREKQINDYHTKARSEGY